MGKKLPTVHEPASFTPEAGGRLLYRRARRTAQALIMRAVGNELAGGYDALLAMLIVRWGLVGAESLIDAETGDDVPWRVDGHATLGKIAHESIYDALSDRDVERLGSLIWAGREPEANDGGAEEAEEEGKSDGSPAGPTAGAAS